MVEQQGYEPNLQGRSYLLELSSSGPLNFKAFKERLAGTSIMLDEDFSVVPVRGKNGIRYTARGVVSDEERERIERDEQDENNPHKLGIKFWGESGTTSVSQNY